MQRRLEFLPMPMCSIFYNEIILTQFRCFLVYVTYKYVLILSFNKTFTYAFVLGSDTVFYTDMLTTIFELYQQVEQI